MKDLERTFTSVREKLESTLANKPISKRHSKAVQKALDEWSDADDPAQYQSSAGLELLLTIKRGAIAIHDSDLLIECFEELRYHEAYRFVTNAQWKYEIGEALTEAKCFDRALNFLNEAYHEDRSVFRSQVLLTRFEKALSEVKEPTVSPARRQKAQSLYDQARQAHEEGNDREAYKLLMDIHTSARTYECWFLLSLVADNNALFAEDYNDADRRMLFEVAESALAHISQQGRETLDWNMRMGFHLMALDQYHQALPYFEKAYTLEPNNEFAFRQMHECIEFCGREAMLEYTSAANAERIMEDTETPAFFNGIDLKAFWDPKGQFAEQYTGKAFTTDDVHLLEQALQCHLPNSYLVLLMSQNGGVPLRRAYPLEGVDEDEQDPFFEIQGFYPLEALRDAQPKAADWYPKNGLRFASSALNAEDGFFFDFDELDSYGQPAIVYASKALHKTVYLEPCLDSFLGALVPRGTYDVKTNVTVLIDRALNAPLTPELFKLVQAAKDGALINLALRRKLSRIPRRTRELVLDDSEDARDFLSLLLWVYTRTHPVMKLEDFVSMLPSLMNREGFMGVTSLALADVEAWADGLLKDGRVEVLSNGYHQLSKGFIADVKALIAGYEAHEPKQFHDRLEAWHHSGYYRLMIETIRMLNTEDRDDNLMGIASGAYINLGEPDKALMILEQLRERYPSEPTWYYRYGLALYHQGLKDEDVSGETFKEAHKALMMALSLKLREPMRSSAKDVLADLERFIRFSEDFDKTVSNTVDKVFVNIAKKIEKEPLQEYRPEEREAVLAHIRSVYGEQIFIWEDAHPVGIRCDVVCVPPTAERPYITLITLGMGALTQEIPEDVTADVRHCELILALPEDWPLTSTEPKDMVPLGMLNAIAHRPLFVPGNWLAFGVSLDMGAAFAPESPFEGVVCAAPQGLTEEKTMEAARLTLPGGETVNFYQVIPLYKEELRYKEKWGFESLMESLLSNVTFLYDPNRPNSGMDVTTKVVGKA